MAVGDYSTTAGSNTSISGIGIAENCSPGNINNAIRQLMADLATWYASVEAALGGGADFQPLDATLTALAGVTTSANKLIYATGSDTFSTTDISAFARTILDDADAATVRTTIGAGVAPVVSGTGGSSCSIALGGGLVLTTRDFTIAANTSAAQTYGNSYTYTSWARAWIEGDDTGATDVSMWVTSHGLSSATVFNDGGGSATGVLFSIGV